MNVHATEITAASWKALDAAGKAHAIIAAYDDRHNTASTIASRLSAMLDCDVSRNSVVGVYHRVTASALLKDFPLRGFNPLLAKSYIGRVRAARLKIINPPTVKKTKVAPVKTLTPPKGPETMPEMRVTAAPEPFLKTLLEMGSKECRWPVEGDKAMTRFCCHEVMEGRSYCQFHHNLSRGSGTLSERAAHRDLKRFAA